jgi:hypothetical protein
VFPVEVNEELIPEQPEVHVSPTSDRAQVAMDVADNVPNKIEKQSTRERTEMKMDLDQFWSLLMTEIEVNEMDINIF